MPEQTQDCCHLTYEASMELGVLVNHELVVYQGPYAEIVAKAKTLRRGMRVAQAETEDPGGGTGGTIEDPGSGTGGTIEDPGSGTGGTIEEPGSGDPEPAPETADVPTSLPAGGDDTEPGATCGYVRVANVKARRERGGNGTLTVLLSQNVHACIVGVEHAEVSKNILTWHADRTGTAKPDLGKIAEWRAQEASDPGKYAALKIGGEDLADATRELARMIRDGIEGYPLYYPVVTVTATLDNCPQLSLYPLNAVGEPSTPNGWPDSRGRTIEDVLTAIGTGYRWIRVVSKATPNPDGTYQFVQAWQSADTVDAALYDQTGAGGAS